MASDPTPRTCVARAPSRTRPAHDARRHPAKTPTAWTGASWPRRTRSSSPLSRIPHPHRAVIRRRSRCARRPGENAAAQTGPSWPRRTRSSAAAPRPTPAPCCPSSPLTMRVAIRARTPPHRPLPHGRAGPGAPPPLAASHSRTVPSQSPLTMRAPSGENAAAQTGPSWPRRTRSSAAARGVPHPAAVAVPSDPPETMRAPSGENARRMTGPSWPRRTRSSARARRAPTRRTVAVTRPRSRCARHRAKTATRMHRPLMAAQDQELRRRSPASQHPDRPVPGAPLTMRATVRRKRRRTRRPLMAAQDQKLTLRRHRLD